MRGQGPYRAVVVKGGERKHGTLYAHPHKSNRDDMPRGRTVRTPKKSRLFLEGLRQTGVISYACKMAGIGQSTAYQWRADDDLFAKAWNEALEEALDALELEARRRAHDGLIRKKFHKDGTPIIDPETGEQYYER